jgi:hypothetical protein
MLASHLHIMPRLRICGGISPLTQVLKAWHFVSSPQYFHFCHFADEKRVDLTR